MPIRTTTGTAVPKPAVSERRPATTPGRTPAAPEPQPRGWTPGPGRAGPTAPAASAAAMALADIKDEAVRRAASRLVDRPDAKGVRDGKLSRDDLDAAVRKRDPALFRTLEKAWGSGAVAGLKTGADLEKLLKAGAVQGPGAVELGGPTPRYDKLFEGPKSEWVVAFGGDSHHASSEKAPPDVSQYRGFKTFLERQGFKPEARQAGIDNTGYAVYSKTLKAPDGHEHTLTVKVFNSSQFEGAADEFQKTSAERRGYFSLSHAGEGMGMNIGGQFIRPENMLKTPAPGIIMAPIACKSFEHFGTKVDKYLQQNGIPKDKVAFFGTSQEIEMTQADGAMAILKQAFTGALGAKSGAAILKAADDAYSPIMASYDPGSYEANRDRMVMDADLQATPVLKGLVLGQAVELPKG